MGKIVIGAKYSGRYRKKKTHHCHQAIYNLSNGYSKSFPKLYISLLHLLVSN